MLIYSEDPPSDADNPTILGSSYSLSINESTLINDSLTAGHSTPRSMPRSTPRQRPSPYASQPPASARSLPGGLELTPLLPPIPLHLPSPILDRSHMEQNALLLQVLDICKATLSCVQAIKAQVNEVAFIQQRSFTK